MLRLTPLLAPAVLLLPPASARAQDQDRSHDPAAAAASGDGELAFAVVMTSAQLPERVRETSPLDPKQKRSILECAHGGFAFDGREGKGEVYWFLPAAGILRIRADRSEVELLDTDRRMLEHNMHNATFFVHRGEGRIAWPSNDAGCVFVTDVDGKVLQVIERPTVPPYPEGAAYSPTDTDYLDGRLWVSDGYGSKFVMSYDLDESAWTGTIFGGSTDKAEPGKFGTNHGFTIHERLLWVSGRSFARIHSYRPDTAFVGMFALPEGSKPCDFEFFAAGGRRYGVAASLDKADGSEDQGASIYIVDMEDQKVVSTIKPRDELGLSRFVHIHNVFPTVEGGRVTLFCQSWNPGDFAVLRQVQPGPK